MYTFAYDSRFGHVVSNKEKSCEKVRRLFSPRAASSSFIHFILITRTRQQQKTHFNNPRAVFFFPTPFEREELTLACP